MYNEKTLRISLLGYMGSGKSSVGRILAERLHCDHSDLDAHIEGEVGCTLSELIASGGDGCFRKIEREALQVLLEKPNMVLSLGGGTPAYYDNMERINQKSRSVYLRTPVKDLTQRLLPTRSKRPLIAEIPGEALAEFIAKHLFERAAYYERADLIVENNAQKTPGDIAAEICQNL